MRIVICVSCKIALGKLRRVTNITRALKEQNSIPVSLLANSGPKGVQESLNSEELALFDSIEDCEPDQMTHRLTSIRPEIAVVDTMNPRNLDKVEAQLCLILREVLPEELQKFRMKNDRIWDLIILPHPSGFWTPDEEMIRAKRIESVGWIYRLPSAANERPAMSADPTRKILITTGGGSGEDQGNNIRSAIGKMIADLRTLSSFPLKVTEVIGPRDWRKSSITGIDATIHPGPELHNLFRQADLVLSAAGYNSVLELACTDVPVLLIPVPRYTDDQEKRARIWGKKLGMFYSPDQTEECVRWMTQVLANRMRRAAIDLGPTGANKAAELILQLTATTQT